MNSLPQLVIEHHMKTLSAPMKEWRSSHHVPPALLLTGLPGVGKRSMAIFLTRWILCEKNGVESRSEHLQPEHLQDANARKHDANATKYSEHLQPEHLHDVNATKYYEELAPCEQCSSCKKAVSGNSIDFTEIQAEDDTFKIDQFRALKSTQGFGAHESSHRIFLISDADRMTTQAANSMLKLLEEPPRGWIFLLTTADQTLLLPTIVSRCHAIRLKPFSRETLSALLKGEGLDEKRRAVCVELAQGSWGKAWAWAQDEIWERRKAVIDFLREPKSNLSALVDFAASEPEHMNQVLDQLESLLAELIHWSLSEIAPEKNPWLNVDASASLSHYAQTASRRGVATERERWIARSTRIARARQELQAPINRKLLAQDVLMPWLA